MENKREGVLYMFMISICLKEEEFEELCDLLRQHTECEKWISIFIEKARRMRN